MSKHICFVSPKLIHFLYPDKSSSAGGAERQQHLLANEFVNRGYDVSVVTNRTDGRVSENVGEIAVHQAIPTTHGMRTVPHRALALLRALRRVNADIYYVRGNPLISVITSFYCEIFNEKYLYAVANDANVEPAHLRDLGTMYRSLFVRSFKRADSVVCLTEHQKKVLEEEHGVSATVIPCGYTLPELEEIVPQSDRDYVLWVGRIDSHQKKPRRFLELARTLSRIQFVMIGAPNEGEEEFFEQVREEAESIPNLSFKGFVPPDKVASYFREAALVINTSDREGFGNIFLEAWRYATPVVSLHYSLDGIIANKPVGVLAGSKIRLAKNVKNLIDNVDERKRLGDNGRKLVANRFSIQAVADQYEEVFNRLVHSIS